MVIDLFPTSFPFLYIGCELVKLTMLNCRWSKSSSLNILPSLSSANIWRTHMNSCDFFKTSILRDYRKQQWYVPDVMKENVITFFCRRPKFYKTVKFNLNLDIKFPSHCTKFLFCNLVFLEFLCKGVTLKDAQQYCWNIVKKDSVGQPPSNFY